jgi:hypothetical protein
MSNKLASRTGHLVLIIALYLPLVAYVTSLRDRLAPGEGLTDLPLTSLLVLLLLLLLPHTVLALLGVRWNPSRSRLGEPEA